MNANELVDSNFKLEHSRDIEKKDYEVIVAWAQKMAGNRTVGA